MVLGRQSVRCLSQQHGPKLVRIVRTFPVAHKPAVTSPLTCQQIKLFHVTQSTKTPKLIIVLVRPLISIISGRMVRQWWRRKPIHERAKLVQWLIRHKHKLWAAVAAYFASVVIYYAYSLEETPMTKRKRFMAFTRQQLREINEEAAVAMASSFPGKLTCRLQSHLIDCHLQ